MRTVNVADAPDRCGCVTDNIPYFPEIYNASGYPAMVAKYGSPYSYEHCQRANIFRRNQTTVSSVEDVQELMR